ncbi:MAG TPA: hypothetical protein VEV65_12010, partial [Kineosporiaceae bacterium]|nr:hypothetical protein [Kineosporiaceae bacterium]
MSTSTGPSSPPPLPPEPGVAPTVPVASPPPPSPRPGSGIAVLRVVGTVVAILVVAAGTLGVVSRFFHQERVQTAVYPQPVREIAVRATTGDV